MSKKVKVKKIGDLTVDELVHIHKKGNCFGHCSLHIKCFSNRKIRDMLEEYVEVE